MKPRTNTHHHPEKLLHTDNDDEGDNDDNGKPDLRRRRGVARRAPHWLT